MTTIELSRKRKKQIKKLKGGTTTLLGEQRKVLEHASALLAEARSNAADAARKDVAPRVREAIDKGVRPAVASGVQAATSAANTTKERFTSEVLPGLISTAGSAMSVVDLAKDPRVRKLVAEATKSAGKAGAKVTKASRATQKASKKKGLGFGGVALIVVGVAALAAAGYAAYQTLRADDDLWVADEAGSDKPAA